MDGTGFDRLSKLLFGVAPRRAAIQTIAGTGLAVASGTVGSDVAGAKKKKKKRCRRRTQTCGGKKKCCKKSELVVCDVVTLPMECADSAKDVCCGQDGAPCNPDRNSCDCCGELFCVQYETENLCRSEAT
jgi:hypothetical protein